MPGADTALPLLYIYIYIYIYIYVCVCVCVFTYIAIFVTTYRVSHEECARLRKGVP